MTEYAIEPEPGAAERAAIVAALERIADEAAPTPWARPSRIASNSSGKGCVCSIGRSSRRWAESAVVSETISR